jgi:hypothetical protein
LTAPDVPGFDTTATGTPEKQAQITVDGQQFVTVYSTKLDVGQLQITNNNELTVNAENIKMILSTKPATGAGANPEIEFRAPLSLVIDQIYPVPATESNRIKIYTKAKGPGGTGIFFVNSENVRDEVPSKRRAFFASLMF